MPTLKPLFETACLSLTAADLDRSAVSPALRALAREGLPWGAELNQVTDDVHQTAHRLDNKVRRVTQGGKIVWEHQA